MLAERLDRELGVRSDFVEHVRPGLPREADTSRVCLVVDLNS